MALQKDYKFVAAIKLGSAYSGYAYSFYDDFTQNPLKIGTYPWTLCGRDDATQKTASSILFTSDGTFKNFGYNAEENYNCEQGDLYFHRFPQNNTVLDENSMLTAKSGNKMPALDIYAAAIEYLTDHLTSKIHNRIYSIPDDKKLWTLIDTHSECKNKDFLIKAARKAGIDGEIGVVQKTDAAVGYYMCACRCRGEKFSPKSDYLIIDATVFVRCNISDKVMGRVGGTSKKLYTLVMTKASWLGAKEYCIRADLGTLMVTSESGVQLVDVRHQYLNTSAHKNDPFWTGFIKPDYNWFTYKNCGLIEILFANDMTGSEQCVLLNMTKDDSNIQWYANSCRERHYFICYKKIDELMFGTHVNKDVNVDVPPSSWKDQQRYTYDECKQKFVVNYHTFAAKYIPDNSSCIFYNTVMQVVPFNFTLVNTTVDTILLVKENVNEFSIITPTSYTEPATHYTETLPCNTYQTSCISETMLLSTALASHPVPSLVLNSNIKCICSCLPKNTEISTDLLSLQQELKLDKKMLSSYRRRLSCASDDRVSSRGLGAAGICVIVSVCLLIFAADVPHFIDGIRLLKKVKALRNDI